MRKLFIVLLVPVLLLACTPSEKDESTEAERSFSQSRDNALELVDMRLYEDGSLKINGASLSQSALTSHLNALAINRETKVRVSSSNQVPTGLVHRLTKEFAIRKVSNVEFNMMPPAEFEEYDQHHTTIDVLQNRRIMLNGTPLYIADLSTALESKVQQGDDFTPIIWVSDGAVTGDVFDVQKIIYKAVRL
jgi:biopolymer transport protein ExbD